MLELTTAHPEIVGYFKRRFEFWKKQDCPGADVGIRAILEILNQHPEIATIYSCTGHPDKPDSDNFYIMFAVTEAGLPALQHLFLLLREQLVKDASGWKGFVQAVGEEGVNTEGLLAPQQYPNVRPDRLSLSFTTRFHTFWGSGLWYPVAILNAYGTEKPMVLNNLFVTLHNLLPIWQQEHLTIPQ